MVLQGSALRCTPRESTFVLLKAAALTMPPSSSQKAFHDSVHGPLPKFSGNGQRSSSGDSGSSLHPQSSDPRHGHTVHGAPPGLHRTIDHVVPGSSQDRARPFHYSLFCVMDGHSGHEAAEYLVTTLQAGAVANSRRAAVLCGPNDCHR